MNLNFKEMKLVREKDEDVFYFTGIEWGEDMFEDMANMQQIAERIIPEEKHLRAEIQSGDYVIYFSK